MHLGTGRQIHPDRYLDFFNVFDEVLQAAIDERVDALLIAGDLFDTKEPDVETLARTIALLKRLKDEHPAIQVLAIEGNHDIRKRAVGVYRNEQGALDVLASAGLLRVLRPEQAGDEPLDFAAATYHAPHHSVSVLGLGYQRENPEERYNEALAFIAHDLGNREVILLQHMMLAPEGMLYHGSTHPSRLNEGPSNLKYVGLGHGHSRITPEHTFHRGLFCAPGSLEFIHVRNVGKASSTRGYFVVEMRGNRPTIEHRETVRKRLFVRKKVALDPARDVSFDALRQRLISTFETDVTDPSARPILSVELTGRLGFAAADFRSSSIQRDLRERFDALQVLVDRRSVQALSGETIQLETLDDYTDALGDALRALLTENAIELGLATADPRILQCLQDAIANPDATEEALSTIEERLQATRSESAVINRQLDITGLNPDAIKRSIAELTIQSTSDAALRVTLVGRAPEDEDGIPIALDWERVTGALADRVVVIPCHSLYEPADAGGA